MVLSEGLKVVSSSPSAAFAEWSSVTWTPPVSLDVLEEFDDEVFDEPVFDALPVLALPPLVLPTLKLQASPAKTRSASASRPEWILIRGVSPFHSRLTALRVHVRRMIEAGRVSARRRRVRPRASQG